MKILTETKNGGMAIELNPSEYREFARLVSSVEGKTLNEVYSVEFVRNFGEYNTEHDLSTVFGAIEAFYAQQFRVNDIQRGLDILKKSLREDNA